MKPPSTARTAGRSDWAERRFRRQPFILLSFSSSKKARKAQETQSYQRFQHTGHTAFNTSGTNGPRGETGAFRTGPLSLPSERSARSQTSPGRVSKRCTLPFLGLGRVCSRRTQRAYGTAMCLCASLFRRRRGPAGLRRPTPPAERTVLAPISPRVQLCLRRPAFPLSAFIPGA